MSSCDAKPLLESKEVFKNIEEFMAAEDYSGLEKYLFECLEKAKSVSDHEKEIAVYINLMRFYYFIGNKDKALLSIEKAVEIIERTRLSESVSIGEFYLNCGVIFASVGMTEEATSALTIAQNTYEFLLDKHDKRLGGIYRRIALVLADMNLYNEANDYFLGALNILSLEESRQAERAQIYLEIAKMEKAKMGEEDGLQNVQRLLDLAKGLLDDPNVIKNQEYVEIGRKCAEIFREFGEIKYCEELNERVRSTVY